MRSDYGRILRFGASEPHDRRDVALLFCRFLWERRPNAGDKYDGGVERQSGRCVSPSPRHSITASRGNWPKPLLRRSKPLSVSPSACKAPREWRLEGGLTAFCTASARHGPRRAVGAASAMRAAMAAFVDIVTSPVRSGGWEMVGPGGNSIGALPTTGCFAAIVPRPPRSQQSGPNDFGARSRQMKPQPRTSGSSGEPRILNQGIA